MTSPEPAAFKYQSQPLVTMLGYVRHSERVAIWQSMKPGGKNRRSPGIEVVSELGERNPVKLSVSGTGVGRLGRRGPKVRRFVLERLLNQNVLNDERGRPNPQIAAIAITADWRKNALVRRRPKPPLMVARLVTTDGR